MYSRKEWLKIFLFCFFSTNKNFNYPHKIGKKWNAELAIRKDNSGLGNKKPCLSVQFFPSEFPLLHIVQVAKFSISYFYKISFFRFKTKLFLNEKYSCLQKIYSKK